MALKVEVKKVSVTSKGEKFKNDFHTITMNLKVLDGVIEVINKDFSIDYKSVHTLSDKLPEMTERMKEEIDKYQAEKVILDQLDAEALKIKTSLTEAMKK